MKFLKYVAFILVYCAILVKEVGFNAFVNAWNQTKKIIVIE